MLWRMAKFTNRFDGYSILPSYETFCACIFEKEVWQKKIGS